MKSYTSLSFAVKAVVFSELIHKKALQKQIVISSFFRELAPPFYASLNKGSLLRVGRFHDICFSRKICGRLVPEKTTVKYSRPKAICTHETMQRTKACHSFIRRPVSSETMRILKSLFPIVPRSFVSGIKSGYQQCCCSELRRSVSEYQRG